MAGSGNSDENAEKASAVARNGLASASEHRPSHLAPMDPCRLPSPPSPSLKRPKAPRLGMPLPSGLPANPASNLPPPPPPPYVQHEPPSPAFSHTSSFVALDSLKQHELQPLDLQPPQMGRSPYGGGLGNSSTYSVYNYSTDWIPMQPPTPRNGGFGVSSTGVAITMEDEAAEARALKKRKRLRLFIFCGIPAVAIMCALIMGMVFGVMRLGSVTSNP